MLTQPSFKRVRGEASNSGWTPETDAEREAVRQQLQRLIENPLLSQSRRYSTLLRYVVEKTLDGGADQLKERTVGTEVFGRDPSYDTSTDPVVRTTAAQLRRRIARYYFEPGHEQEIVIELPSGGYAPEFRLPRLSAVSYLDSATEETVLTAPVALHAEVATPARGTRFARLHWVLLAVGLVLLISAGWGVRALTAPRALDTFWKPVWDTPGSILVTVGVPSRRGLEIVPTPAVSVAPTLRESLAANSIAWPDAITFSSVVGLVRAKGRDYHLQKSSATAFSDLRSSPSVLIGGYNNQWIMRLGAPLRFRYTADWDRGRAWIEDQQNPSQQAWSANFRAPFSALEEDYGIITRVTDPGTERVVVFVSGIASYATIAAGEFVTNEKYMKMVEVRAPKGWERKNLQVVFSTPVINGNSGPPRILATHFW